jgi:hypothetical protein
VSKNFLDLPNWVCFFFSKFFTLSDSRKWVL